MDALEFSRTIIIIFCNERKQTDKHWSSFSNCRMRQLWLNENDVIDVRLLDEHVNNMFPSAAYVGKSQKYRIDSIIDGFIALLSSSHSISYGDAHNNRSIKLNNNEVVSLHWCVPLLPKGWSVTKFCLLFIHTIKTFINTVQFICSLLLILLSGHNSGIAALPTTIRTMMCESNVSISRFSVIFFYLHRHHSRIKEIGIK